jgi:predicted phage tail component-like protein
MSQLTFNYCGFDAIIDLDLIVNDITIPVAPEISENVQDVPGMVGKIFLGNSYGQKIFNIEVTIKAKDSTDLTSRLQDLTEIVVATGDDEYPMQFSTDPGYTHYGHFTAVSAPERITRNSAWRRVVLTFACSDPKGYGDYITYDLESNPKSIVPLGKSECYPVFTCMPKNNISKIAVTDEDGNYVFLGAGVDPDTGDTVQNLEPRVFTDAANDLNLWTPVTSPTFSIDSGVVRGNYRTTTTSITPNSFGDNYAGKWHGPLIQRWLPASYSNFRVRARMLNHQAYSRSMGKVELYLLNSNGGRIGKIALSDNWTDRRGHIRVEVGPGGGNTRAIYSGVGTTKDGKKETRTIKVKNGTKTVKVKGKNQTVQQWKNVNLSSELDTSTFSNFYGYIELQKIGNKYRVEILKLTLNSSNPGWSKPLVYTWTDTNNYFTNNQLAGVALYSGKFDIYEDIANPRVVYTNTRVELNDLTVNEIIGSGNTPTAPQVIARSGDEVKINCEDHKVYKNGRYFMDHFYIGSQFPVMQGGVPKTFAFEPGLDEADWYVEYTPTTS